PGWVDSKSIPVFVMYRKVEILQSGKAIRIQHCDRLGIAEVLGGSPVLRPIPCLVTNPNRQRQIKLDGLAILAERLRTNDSPFNLQDGVCKLSILEKNYKTAHERWKRRGQRASLKYRVLFNVRVESQAFKRWSRLQYQMPTYTTALGIERL